jgi:hypothetical protein
VQDTGFSHGFGRLDANRQLVEWMRRFNADPSHRVKLPLYGFDSPTEMTGSDGPRQVVHFVPDYLASIDSASGREHRERIDLTNPTYFALTTSKPYRLRLVGSLEFNCVKSRRASAATTGP